MARLLIVDDESAHREILSRSLESEGHTLATAADGEDALAQLAKTPFDLVFLDVNMPRLNGLETLKRLAARSPQTPLPIVIMLSANDQADHVIEAMKLGAYDYLTKPYHTEEIPLLVAKALEHRQLARTVETLTAPPHAGGPRLIGRHPAVLDIFKSVGRIANHRTTVLVRGESGTGKELVARLIHEASPWHDQPFIPVDCASLPATLIESELFGYEKGAFTGALQTTPGKFEAAKSGTLFLDEIGNIEPDIQAKLLRVLQERTFTRLGSHVPLATEARIIAATHVNLEEAVREGRFRQDLYYRLAVVQLTLPPLRDRREDIALLTQYLLQRLAASGRPLKSLAPDALTLLCHYPWPGNVRELEHALERAVALSPRPILLPSDFSLAAASNPPPTHATGQGQLGHQSLDAAVEELESRWIREALQHSGGVQTKAAQLLNISLRMLRYKMKKYGLEKSHISNLRSQNKP